MEETNLFKIINQNDHSPTDVTDVTLGASVLWLGTRTGAAGTTTLAWSFFGRRLWLHGRKKKVETTNTSVEESEGSSRGRYSNFLDHQDDDDWNSQVKNQNWNNWTMSGSTLQVTMIGKLLVSRSRLVEDDAVQVFHYYCFHLSSSFLV